MINNFWNQHAMVIVGIFAVVVILLLIHRKCICRWLDKRKQENEKKQNDFLKMCKALDKNWDEQSGLEKYISADKAVREYVDNDRNKLLQIKSEAVSENYSEFTSIMIAEAAMLAGVLSIFASIFNWANDEIIGKYGQGALEITINRGQNWYGTIIAFSIAGFVIYGMYKILANKCISRWRGYILTAIEALEKDI